MLRQSNNIFRPGMTSVYLICIMSALVGVTSLGVDLARVQCAQTELVRVADATSHAACANLLAGGDATTARAAAKSIAALNSVDGSPVVLNDSDIDVGYWNGSSFLNNGTPTNAVRIRANRTVASGNAIPLTFAKVLGRSYCDAKAQSTAMVTFPVTTTLTVLGTFDPFLVGTADGTNASSDDWAGPSSPNGVDCRPTAATGLNLAAGNALTFSFSGAVRNNPTYANYGPDGNLSWIISHVAGSQNGIAQVTMPINATLGVFLNDNDPSTTPAPRSNLDFSSAASRDFSTLSPGLKQPFFIGDGLDSHGNTQQFIVPAGATRLFICTMDGYEWSNNMGSFTETIHTPGHVNVVK